MYFNHDDMTHFNYGYMTQFNYDNHNNTYWHIHEFAVIAALSIYIYIAGVGSGGGGGGGGGVDNGGMCPPLFWLGGGEAMVCLCPPPLTPNLYFPLELYVYITLTNNYLAFFIYQLIILWTISINWHRWLLLNNHISKYNSFILVLYRRYINCVSVCTPTFWHLPTPVYTYVLV